MNVSDQEQSQLAAFALGALDRADLPAVEQLLASSPEQREELRQLREVVALLPYAAPPASPPAHIRDRLLARVAAQQAAAPPARPAAAPPRRRAWLAPAAFSALAALVLLLGGLTFSLQQSVAGLAETNRQLVGTLTDLQAALATSELRQAAIAAQISANERQISQLSDQLRQEQLLVSFVSAPGVATRELAPAQAGLSARGEMYMYPGESSAVVIFSGLPPLQPGTVYQFWLADGTTQIAGGTFQVDQAGLATLVVSAPREVNAFSDVMLTVEPTGGSATPSLQVVLEGSL